MLHSFLSHFFGYESTTTDVAQISLNTKNTHYKRWDTISGIIEIDPLQDFHLYKDPISLSLKWKSLGNDQRLRDFFRDNHITLPKQTREYPQIFNKWNPVFLDFSLATKEYFTHQELRNSIQELYQDNKISWDQWSIHEIIESLETFSWHLQCVVLNTVKTFPLALDASALQETIERLQWEKEKLKNSIIYGKSY